MKHPSEEQLSLYAWGDLHPQDHHAITGHLRDCGQCRKLLSEFEEAQRLITASLQNPTESELSEVRTRLTARLRPQGSRVRPGVWWSAGVAAALTLLALPHVVNHQPSVAQNVEQPVLAERIPPGPMLQIPLTPVATSRPKRSLLPKAGIRSVTLISQADREPIIKMTTADPNVIILWQLNKGGE